MLTRLEVLDHGSVGLIDWCGSDQTIVEGARMSTGRGFKGWVLDERFLKYLWDNQHSSPFEFGDVTFEVQAPIFVFREWHRHRTQSYSEASARYTELPDTHYLPELGRLIDVDYGTKNKQAQGNGKVISKTRAKLLQSIWRTSYWLSDLAYRLTLYLGAPKELARIVMPVGRYSKMRCKANLRNWLAFLKLRQAPNAQYEIRQYANAVHALLTELFPRTMAIHDGMPMSYLQTRMVGGDWWYVDGEGSPTEDKWEAIQCVDARCKTAYENLSAQGFELRAVLPSEVR